MRGLRAVAAMTAFAAAMGTSLPDARADEPAAPQARVAARRAIVDGDLERARAILKAAPSDVAAAERAASAELLFVIEEWSSAGRPRAVAEVNEAPIPDGEDDWERSFANGRHLLVAGHYAESARRFDALVATAPDLVAGARAAELRALARDAASGVEPVAPAISAPPRETAPVSKSNAETKPETETRWYGWQTLLSDGLAVVATPLAPPLGLGMYLLGAPIVHLVHLNGWSVLGSLGVRVITPTIGAFVGAAAAEGCNGFLCELEGAAVGALIGVGIAVVVDATLLAREQVPVKKKTATFVPTIAPGRVGVLGTF